MYYKIVNFKNKFNYLILNKIYIFLLILILTIILEFNMYDKFLILSNFDLIFIHLILSSKIFKFNYLYNLILIRLFIINIFNFLNNKKCYLKLIIKILNLFCFMILNSILLIKILKFI